MSITREELNMIEELLRVTDTIGNKDLTNKQWKFIFDKSINDHVSIDSIKLIANPGFNLEQMEMIIYALETLILPKHNITRYCIPDIESEIMKIIFDDLSNGVPVTFIDKCIMEYLGSGKDNECFYAIRGKLLKNPFDTDNTNNTNTYAYFIAYSYEEIGGALFGNCFMDLNRKIKSRKDINELQDKIADKYDLDNVTIINYFINE
jgi:hypothetical protein